MLKHFYILTFTAFALLNSVLAFSETTELSTKNITFNNITFTQCLEIIQNEYNVKIIYYGFFYDNLISYKSLNATSTQALAGILKSAKMQNFIIAADESKKIIRLMINNRANSNLLSKQEIYTTVKRKTHDEINLTQELSFEQKEMLIEQHKKQVDQYEDSGLSQDQIVRLKEAHDKELDFTSDPLSSEAIEKMRYTDDIYTEY